MRQEKTAGVLLRLRIHLFTYDHQSLVYSTSMICKENKKNVSATFLLDSRDSLRKTSINKAAPSERIKGGRNEEWRGRGRGGCFASVSWLKGYRHCFEKCIISLGDFLFTGQGYEMCLKSKSEEIQHLEDKFSHFRGGRRVRRFFMCVPQVFSRCRCQLGPVSLCYSYISNQFRFLNMRRYSS